MLASALSTFHRSSSVSCPAIPTNLHVKPMLLSNGLLYGINDWQYSTSFVAKTQMIRCQIYFLQTTFQRALAVPLNQQSGLTLIEGCFSNAVLSFFAVSRGVGDSLGCSKECAIVQEDTSDAISVNATSPMLHPLKEDLLLTFRAEPWLLTDLNHMEGYTLKTLTR